MDILVVVDYQKDFVNGALGFKKAETLEEDKDTYCEFMKGMILNTYSVN